MLIFSVQTEMVIYQSVNLLFWEVFVRFKPIYSIIIGKVFLRFQLEGIVK